MHQLETLIDLVQRKFVGDHRIDLDLAVHIPINNLGHIGATLRAAKRRTAPDAACDQLERTGGDFRTRRGYPDDDALAIETDIT